MKKFIFTLLSFYVSVLVFSQTSSSKQVFTNKLVLNKGQKVFVETIISMEANLSPGMDMTNKTSSLNTLEVKSITDNNYTISNTVTKIKVDMDMMGQSTSYDSDKKEDQDTEIGKGFSDKLNKPQDYIIDIITGKNLSEKKKDKKNDAEEANSAGGLLSMFTDNTEDATVTGAFELVPAGKNTGDSWSDSSILKDKKVVRIYNLKSITGNEALIHLDVVMDANNTIEIQGMSMEFSSTTKSKEDIITDISTGRVKSRTTLSDIFGNIQIMGQSVPISAKANSTSTYK